MADTFDPTAAALDVVGAVIAANAEMLAQPLAIHAGVTPDGQIALYRNTDPEHPAKVLGSPEHAVFIAQRAFLRCGEQTRGRTSL